MAQNMSGGTGGSKSFLDATFTGASQAEINALIDKKFGNTNVTQNINIEANVTGDENLSEKVEQISSENIEKAQEIVKKSKKNKVKQPVVVQTILEQVRSDAAITNSTQRQFVTNIQKHKTSDVQKAVTTYGKFYSDVEEQVKTGSTLINENRLKEVYSTISGGFSQAVDIYNKISEEIDAATKDGAKPKDNLIKQFNAAHQNIQAMMAAYSSFFRLTKDVLSNSVSQGEMYKNFTDLDTVSRKFHNETIAGYRVPEHNKQYLDKTNEKNNTEYTTNIATNIAKLTTSIKTTEAEIKEITDESLKQEAISKLQNYKKELADFNATLLALNPERFDKLWDMANKAGIADFNTSRNKKPTTSTSNNTTTVNETPQTKQPKPSLSRINVDETQLDAYKRALGSVTGAQGGIVDEIRLLSEYLNSSKTQINQLITEMDKLDKPTEEQVKDCEHWLQVLALIERRIKAINALQSQGYGYSEQEKELINSLSLNGEFNASFKKEHGLKFAKSAREDMSKNLIAQLGKVKSNDDIMSIMQNASNGILSTVPIQDIQSTLTTNMQNVTTEVGQKAGQNLGENLVVTAEQTLSSNAQKLATVFEGILSVGTDLDKYDNMKAETLQRNGAAIISTLSDINNITKENKNGIQDYIAKLLELSYIQQKLKAVGKTNNLNSAEFWTGDFKADKKTGKEMPVSAQVNNDLQGFIRNIFAKISDDVLIVDNAFKNIVAQYGQVEETAKINEIEKKSQQEIAGLNEKIKQLETEIAKTQELLAKANSALKTAESNLNKQSEKHKSEKETLKTKYDEDVSKKTAAAAARQQSADASKIAGITTERDNAIAEVKKLGLDIQALQEELSQNYELLKEYESIIQNLKTNQKTTDDVENTQEDFNEDKVQSSKASKTNVDDEINELNKKIEEQKRANEYILAENKRIQEGAQKTIQELKASNRSLEQALKTAIAAINQNTNAVTTNNNEAIDNNSNNISASNTGVSSGNTPPPSATDSGSLGGEEDYDPRIAVEFSEMTEEMQNEIEAALRRFVKGLDDSAKMVSSSINKNIAGNITGTVAYETKLQDGSKETYYRSFELLEQEAHSEISGLRLTAQEFREALNDGLIKIETTSEKIRTIYNSTQGTDEEKIKNTNSKIATKFEKTLSSIEYVINSAKGIKDVNSQNRLLGISEDGTKENFSVASIREQVNGIKNSTTLVSQELANSIDILLHTLNLEVKKIKEAETAAISSMRQRDISSVYNQQLSRLENIERQTSTGYYANDTGLQSTVIQARNAYDTGVNAVDLIEKQKQMRVYLDLMDEVIAKMHAIKSAQADMNAQDKYKANWETEEAKLNNLKARLETSGFLKDANNELTVMGKELEKIEQKLKEVQNVYDNSALGVYKGQLGTFTTKYETEIKKAKQTTQSDQNGTQTSDKIYRAGEARQLATRAIEQIKLLEQQNKELQQQGVNLDNIRTLKTNILNIQNRLNSASLQDNSAIDKQTMVQMQAYSGEINKIYNTTTKITTGYDKLANTMKSFYKANDNLFFNRELSDQYKQLFATVIGDGSRSEVQLKALKSEWEKFVVAVNTAGIKGNNPISAFSMKFSDIMIRNIGTLAANAMTRYFRNMFQNVREVDSAMTQLKKVTDETSTVYNNFLEGAGKRAAALGASMTDLINSTADFAKLGYEVNEASVLAENALIYSNVGDLDIETATNDLVSATKAFGFTAEETMRIVDSFNEVGNNYAVSAAQLGEGLRNSASSLVTAGTSMDESIAMLTAMTEITQDAASAGSALKILSLRIRGAKVELSEMGENTDDMAISTSKLRKEIKAMTGGFDIMKNENEFKSIYEIMDGLADAVKDMEDIDKTALIEKIAGKNRANQVSALLNNWSQAEKAYETSLNSAGSAAKENAAFVESIEGRISQLTAAFQDLSTTVMNSEFLKVLISSLTELLKLLDKIAEFGAGGGAGLATMIGLAGFQLNPMNGFDLNKYISWEKTIKMRRQSLDKKAERANVEAIPLSQRIKQTPQKIKGSLNNLKTKAAQRVEEFRTGTLISATNTVNDRINVTPAVQVDQTAIANTVAQQTTAAITNGVANVNTDALRRQTQVEFRHIQDYVQEMQYINTSPFTTERKNASINKSKDRLSQKVNGNASVLAIADEYAELNAASIDFETYHARRLQQLQAEANQTAATINELTAQAETQGATAVNDNSTNTDMSNTNNIETTTETTQELGETIEETLNPDTSTANDSVTELRENLTETQEQAEHVTQEMSETATEMSQIADNNGAEQAERAMENIGEAAEDAGENVQGMGDEIPPVDTGLKGLKKSVLGFGAAMVKAFAISAVIGAVISFIDWVKTKIEETTKRTQNLKTAIEDTIEEYNNVKSELENVNSELEDVQSKIEEINKNSLNIVNSEELEQLRQENKELEQRKAILEASEKLQANALEREVTELLAGGHYIYSEENGIEANDSANSKEGYITSLNDLQNDFIDTLNQVHNFKILDGDDIEEYNALTDKLATQSKHLGEASAYLQEQQGYLSKESELYGKIENELNEIVGLYEEMEKRQQKDIVKDFYDKFTAQNIGSYGEVIQRLSDIRASDTDSNTYNTVSRSYDSDEDFIRNDTVKNVLSKNNVQMTVEEDSWNSSISGVTIKADNINSIIAAYNELNKLKAEGLELDEDSYNLLKLHLAQIVGIEDLDIANTLFAFDEEMQIRNLIQQTAGGDIGSITAPDYNNFVQAVETAAGEQKLSIEEVQRVLAELFPEYQTAEDRFINHFSHNINPTIEGLSDLARAGKLTTSDIEKAGLMPSIEAMGVTADEATVYFRRLAEAILETGIASRKSELTDFKADFETDRLNYEENGSALTSSYNNAISAMSSGGVISYEDMKAIVANDEQLVQSFTKVAGGYTANLDKLKASRNQFFNETIKEFEDNITEAEQAKAKAEKDLAKAWDVVHSSDDLQEILHAHKIIAEIEEQIEGYDNEIAKNNLMIGEATEELTDFSQELETVISLMEKWASTYEQAVNDMASIDKLTPSTLLQIKELSPDNWLNLINVDEAGRTTLNAEAYVKEVQNAFGFDTQLASAEHKLKNAQSKVQQLLNKNNFGYQLTGDVEADIAAINEQAGKTDGIEKYGSELYVLLGAYRLAGKEALVAKNAFQMLEEWFMESKSLSEYNEKIEDINHRLAMGWINNQQAAAEKATANADLRASSEANGELENTDVADALRSADEDDHSNSQSQLQKKLDKETKLIQEAYADRLIDADEYNRQMSALEDKYYGTSDSRGLLDDPDGTNLDTVAEQRKARVTEMYEGSVADADKLLEQGLINETQYTGELRRLWEKYYKDRTGFAQESYEAEKRFLDAAKSSIQAQIDGIQSLIDDNSAYYEGQIAAIEEQNEKIEEKYDAEIEAIDKQIELLENKNDEEDKYLKIKEAEAELEKASQRTRKVYGADGTVEYRQDPKAIEEAEEAVVDAKVEVLEDEKSKLEEQRDAELEVNNNRIEALNAELAALNDPLEDLIAILAANLAESYQLSPEAIAAILATDSSEKELDKVNKQNAVAGDKTYNMGDMATIGYNAASKYNSETVSQTTKDGQIKEAYTVIDTGNYESALGSKVQQLVQLMMTSTHTNADMEVGQQASNTWKRGIEDYNVKGTQSVELAFNGNIYVTNPIGDSKDLAYELAHDLPNAFMTQIYTNIKK